LRFYTLIDTATKNRVRKSLAISHPICIVIYGIAPLKRTSCWIWRTFCCVF